MTIINAYLDPELEAVADLCHRHWSAWMIYLFTKTSANEDGSVTIPKTLVERWARQITTRYEDLPESERESDRAEARKFIELLCE